MESHVDTFEEGKEMALTTIIIEGRLTGSEEGNSSTKISKINMDLIKDFVEEIGY